MEGTYDFVDGIAHAISAPQWSIDALRSVQGEFAEAGRALKDERNYTDSQATALLERKLDAIQEQNSELATEVRALSKKLSRGKLAVVVAAIGIVLGVVSDAGGAYEVTSDVVQWVIEQIESGEKPNLP